MARRGIGHDFDLRKRRCTSVTSKILWFVNRQLEKSVRTGRGLRHFNNCQSSSLLDAHTEGTTAHCLEGRTDGQRKDVHQTEGSSEARVCGVDEAWKVAWVFTVGDVYPHTIAQQLLQAAQHLFCFLGLKIVKMASSNTVFSPF